MFGKMLSAGARSNLMKSMVKLHNAQFGSPVHRESVPQVAINLQLICTHWDPHPTNPLLPSQAVVADFEKYLCSEEFDSSDRHCLAIAGANLGDKELENFITIILFFFEMNEDQKSHERYLKDKENIQEFASFIYDQLSNPNASASQSMKLGVKETLSNILSR